ncbi:MAG: phytanoyl-CoA dioxygenase family protein [Cyanobacteriota bacterium]|nr:phytanoyl-CoA dioxygenase family protein [Cyanobacteriota bacterium]
MIASHKTLSLQRDGYVVLRQVIPTEWIDTLLFRLERVKRSRRFRFRAQGTNSFEGPLLDERGNLRNSIQNPHLLGALPAFREAVETIIFSQPIHQALCGQLGEGTFVNWQTMLFDRSVGTKVHQDSWYLDTLPQGGVVGAWIALEDISRECGPFKVYEHTQGQRVEPTAYHFDALEEDPAFQRDFPGARCQRLLLNKGDVILWNSFLFHGADLPSSDAQTRKSLTAHFYRQGAALQPQPIQRAFSIYDHAHPKRTAVPGLLKAATINPLLYSALSIGLANLKARNLTGRGSDLTEIRSLS